jgi:hypothetical protein
MSATAAIGPTEPATSPEAQRIMLLAQIVSLQQERRALSDTDEWAPDKGPLHTRYAEALEQEHEINRRLYHLGLPETLAAARLAARVALAETADRNSDGSVRCEDFGDWLVMAVFQGVTGVRERIDPGETLRYWVGEEDHPEAEEDTPAKVTLTDLGNLADQFWNAAEALATRAGPEHRTTTIGLALAALGQRMGENAQPLLLAAAGAEERHRKSLTGRAGT